MKAEQFSRHKHRFFYIVGNQQHLLPVSCQSFSSRVCIWSRVKASAHQTVRRVITAGDSPPAHGHPHPLTLTTGKLPDVAFFCASSPTFFSIWCAISSRCIFSILPIAGRTPRCPVHCATVVALILKNYATLCSRSLNTLTRQRMLPC